MPEVSVVIPLLNKEFQIARALDSVLAQTSEDFEIVVIEGDSSDRSSEIVDGYSDSRIRVTAQATKGVSSARNQGVQEADSQFIAFLDADDEWTPTHIETLVRLRETYPESGIYATAYEISDASGRRFSPAIRNIPVAPWEGRVPDYFHAAAFGEPPVWTSASAVPKDIFQEMGGFSERMSFGEDIDLWGRIALRYPVVFSWSGKAVYYQDAEIRLSRGEPRDDLLEEFELVKEARIERDIGETFAVDRTCLEEYVAMLEIQRSVRMIIQGHSKTAREVLRSYTSNNFNREKWFWYLASFVPHGCIQSLRRWEASLGRGRMRNR